MSNTIQTVSGQYFFFDSPESHNFPIEEIAHALSHICRYTGHVRQFYSVAQHSVLVSKHVPIEHAFAALMHDASEAYLGDVSSPLKQLLPDYKAYEHRVEKALFAAYGIDFPLHPCVKAADLTLLVTEQRDLMPHVNRLLDQRFWPDLPPLPEEIVPLSHRAAKDQFLRRFYELKRQGH